MSADKDPWADDLLGRRSDAEFLFKFLIRRINEREERGLSKSYVLNLDAGWGEGKSYFLERFAEDLRRKSFLVASVNAWRDDHADDPLFAVMSAIDDVISPLLKNDSETAARWASIKRTAAVLGVAVAKGIILQLLRATFGVGAEAIVKALGGGDGAVAIEEVEKGLGALMDEQSSELLSKFKKTQKSISDFKIELSNFILGISNKNYSSPLFIMIDELDRCRPPYAIALLERVKHLFEVDGVVFLIATDTMQLRHSIGVIYGENFNSRDYLYRFFDRTYRFEHPSLSNFVDQLISVYKIDVSMLAQPAPYQPSDVLVRAFSFFRFTLRDVQHCMDMLRSIMTLWPSSLRIELTVIITMIIAYHKHHTISATSVFTKEMRDFAATIPNRGLWEYEIGGFDSDGVHRTQKITGFDFIEQFFLTLTKPLNEIVNTRVSSPIEAWINSFLKEEFQKMRNEGLHTETFPCSVMSSYPKFVSSVGRLAPHTENRSQPD